MASLQVSKTDYTLRTVFRDPTIDGGVQNAHFFESRSRYGSVLLFVTAARASIYCLHVTLRADDNLADARKYMSAQVDAEAEDKDDCRVMSLSVVHAPDRTASSGNYLLLAGYADGSIRVSTTYFHLEHFCMAAYDTTLSQQLSSFDEISCSFSNIWTSDYHDRCLLAVKLLLHPDDGRLYAITSATDGRIAIWSLSPESDTVEAVSAAVPLTILDKVHQSGVNAIDARGEEGSALSIVSGGDDGAIVYQRVFLGDPAEPKEIVRRIDAHASSIKGQPCMDLIHRREG